MTTTKRRAPRVVAVWWVLLVYFTPPAWASPVSPMCDRDAYREAHPLICDTEKGSGGSPPGAFPGSGGGNPNGGLLGAIRDVIGGLTGGLL